MKKLSEQEKKRISEAVKKAESQTSGELATAIIKQSNDYAIYELFTAVLTGLVYTMFLFTFSSAIKSWLQSLFWGYQEYYFNGFLLFSPFLVILLVYFLANLPVIDRLIVPKKIRNMWVKRRAMQHFWDSGVGKTKDGTGILIFISLLEHQVELLADTGIAAKVESNQWHLIVDKVIDGIKDDKLADKLCEAIRDCGELLAKDFPRLEDDENELSDEIVELTD